MNSHTKTSKGKRIAIVGGAAGLAIATMLGISACSSGSDSSSASSSASASESSSKEAYSQTTYISWQNNLDTDLTFKISDVDSYDWDGTSRPDAAYPSGINNYTLAAGNTYKENLEINRYANTPKFKVAVTDSAGNEVLSKSLVYSPGSKDVELNDWHWNSSSKPSETVSFNYTDSSGKSQKGEVTISPSFKVTTLNFKSS